ncbi:MAG: undecaprenyl diphosphate synthase [Candidatus Tokpelaia sp. JSC161]|jgi:undecaprenyl diphosphate synthase|nr:MAG: undecaprenyl diphosphate synthase [Candidatus Tokpelaia sp. JSC161]
MKGESSRERFDVLLPCHIAIIMDGNGRWARVRNLPRAVGHRAGMKTLQEIVRHASNLGLQWLTLYAFSSENWLRPVDEVEYLLSLLKSFIRCDLVDLHKNNVKIHIIGERDDLAEDIVSLFYEAETLTLSNTGLNLVVAFNYGGRNEIVRAVRKIAEHITSGRIKDDDIDDPLVASYLDTALMPDPDLIIRTSGEMRLSNFLLWQAAYSELSFVPCLWPDFSTVDFDMAIAGFCQRERRFGALEEEQMRGMIL